MKNNPLLFIGIVFFSIVSCKSKSKTTATAPFIEETTAQTQPTEYKGVTNDSCAVEMAFGSYGSGIDGKAFDETIAKIDAKKLKYTAKNIGREGETRLCLPLTEIKGNEKSEFINQLKKIALGGQLVSVSIR